MKAPFILLAALAGICLATLQPAAAQHSVARQWNEENLAAIRISFPDPPVHARNLFHISAAMWDAWAAYDPVAVGYVHNETATAGALAAARHEAISYAAYRVLLDRYTTHRHPNTPLANANTTAAALDALMGAFGYPTANTLVTGSTPAAVGNRVAAAVLAFGASDGSRENSGYDDPTYSPVNQPLIVKQRGTTMAFPNRWQPLAFDFAVSQNGIPIPTQVQTYVGAHWGNVRPFALHRPGPALLYHDPGNPPLLGGDGDQDFKDNSLAVVRFSSWLDPDDGVVQDYSPGSIGNNPLGTDDGTGYETNPVTGEPYDPNPINRADFGRVVAEFWADGPASETPPGHWNTLANEIADHPDFTRQFMGQGPPLDPLEWDVKVYFALNASVHDVAVTAWGCKRVYDYVRPISSIRFMGGKGQSSDPLGQSYHPQGLPLEPGLCEVVTATSAAPGQRHSHLSGHIGEIAINAWAGEPDDPETEYSGAQWILAEDWLPYQRSTFVTPAFAGYTSGHSGFSRAAAEVLTSITGSPFFPGGLSSFTRPAGTLDFELGPSADVTLQWATYYDAADQAGISRLYGGIHVSPDDGPGRALGSVCGKDAWALATQYFDGTILDEPIPTRLARLANGAIEVSWDESRGLFYGLRGSRDLQTFTDIIPLERALDDAGSLTIPAAVVQADPAQFFKVVRSATAP